MVYEFRGYGSKSSWAQRVAKDLDDHVVRIVRERSNVPWFVGSVVLVNARVLPSKSYGEYFPDKIRLACPLDLHRSNPQLASRVVDDGWFGRWNHEWGHYILAVSTSESIAEWLKLWPSVDPGSISSICVNAYGTFCECWSAHLTGLTLPDNLHHFLDELGR